MKGRVVGSQPWAPVMTTPLGTGEMNDLTTVFLPRLEVGAGAVPACKPQSSHTLVICGEGFSCASVYLTTLFKPSSF